MRFRTLTGAAAAAAALAAMILFAGAAPAHISITGVNHGAIRWPGNGTTYLLHPAGSKDVADGSALTALREAFATWNAALGGAFTVAESNAPNAASTNVDDVSTHRVLFDENDDTGYFPAQTGVVAITPIRYNSANRILDADIIFNGRDHSFSTNLAPGTFDVRDVATHEIGHFLGLDHSPQLGASLYPFVDYQQTVHRSLSEDERQAARVIYGAAGGSAQITGVLNHQKPGGGAGAPVHRGYVAARRADGRVAASTLSADDGSFTLAGLEAGDYVVEASPIDGPMSTLNLVSSGTVDTNFSSVVVGASPLQPTHWTLVDGGSADVGSVVAGPVNAPSIQYIGSSGPFTLQAGASGTVYVAGGGFDSATMAYVPGDGLVVAGTQVTAGGTVLTADVFAFPDAKPGLYDLLVVDGAGRLSVEVGAIEVALPAPALASVSPQSSNASGGGIATIIGTQFQPGAIVHIGSQPSSIVTFVSSVEVRAAIPALGPTDLPGAVDVVVVNPDGQEARLGAAFQYAAAPEIDGVFPPAASAGGGKRIRIFGKDFLPGAKLTFVAGGAAASSGGGGAVVPAAVADEGNGWLDVMMPQMPLGTYDVRLENTDGTLALAASAFASVAAADPTIAAFAPAKAPLEGGVAMSIHGSGFVTNMSVRFGADLNTGAGGTAATSVVVLSSGELSLFVPPGVAKGPATILVQSPAGQSAGASGFAYTQGASAGSSSGGGGSGHGPGCALSVGGGGSPWSGIFSSFGALAFAAGVIYLRGRALRPRVAR